MPDKKITELTASGGLDFEDLFIVVENPSVTPVNVKATQAQVLAPAAKLVASNSFIGDQVIDGDLFVTGDITPITRLAEQRPKINQLVGDASGSRTLLSKSLVAGLSLRHDEAAGLARVTVGNYDTQTFQPLVTESASVQFKTGASPPGLVEHLRVHPSGGVSVGDGPAHAFDPGLGVVRALGGLFDTPLNASQLTTGTVPEARLKPRSAYNHNVASQTGFAADQYLGGSDVLLPAGASVQVGTRWMLRFRVAKTGNGQGAPVLTLRCGTTGTLADAAIGTLTLGGQTNAITDVGTFEVWGVFTAAGAAAVLSVYLRLTHMLQSTGLSDRQAATLVGTSTPFNATVATSRLGISTTGGANCGWVVDWVSSELTNLG